MAICARVCCIGVQIPDPTVVFDLLSYLTLLARHDLLIYKPFSDFLFSQKFNEYQMSACNSSSSEMRNSVLATRLRLIYKI